MKKTSLFITVLAICGVLIATFLPVAVSASDGQTMIKPVTGTVSQEFSGTHDGIDIAAPLNTPVYAPSDGVVIDTGWGTTEGYYIVIRHYAGDSNEYASYCPLENWTKYFHLNAILVDENESVSQGDLIGRVGSTGYSTGNHLHFQIHEQSRYGPVVNPREYVRFGDGNDIW